MTSKVIWIFTTLAMIVLNTAATWLPINGLSTGQLSDNLSTLITPAGFTFAIWSVIYLGIIVVTVLFLTNRVKLSNKFLLRYAISALTNGLRIVAWHYQNLHLSMILILILLVSLIVLDRIIKFHAGSIGYYHWIRNIFLLYFGRVQIATLLMTTIYITYQLNIIDNQNVIRSSIVLGLAGLVNLLVIWKEHNIMTSLVALRALWGIANAQSNPIILNVCWIVFAILAANCIALGLKRNGKILS